MLSSVYATGIWRENFCKERFFCAILCINYIALDGKAAKQQRLESVLVTIFRWESGSKEGLSQVIVDPEWGAFGDNGCIDFIKTGWSTYF
jgi:hypothetical protein